MTEDEKAILDALAMQPSFTRLIAVENPEPWMAWSELDGYYIESDDHFRRRIKDSING